MFKKNIKHGIDVESIKAGENLGDFPYFEYGEAEINHLRKKDKKLGTVIDRVGLIKRPTRHITNSEYHFWCMRCKSSGNPGT